MKRPSLPTRSALALAALAAPIGLALAIAQAHEPFRLETLLNRTGVNPIAGRAIFQANCQSCHSISRQGVEGNGPNLAAIGREGGSRRPGLSAPEYILESILDPSIFRAPGARGVMPQEIAATLSAAQVRDLVAFLASQGGRPDLASIARLEIPNERPGGGARPAISRGQMELGLEVFRNKAACANCHTLHAERKYEHLIAPPLFLASAFDDAYLHESIRAPSQVIADGHELVNVATNDGRVLSGRLLRDEPDGLLLLTLDAQGHAEPISIPRDQIATDDDGHPALAQTSVSPMPEGFADTLSPEEIEAVVALLKSLR